MSDEDSNTIIFLSYAIVDDEREHPENRDEKGWVTYFEDRLGRALQRIGRNDVVFWRDVREIPGADRFTPKIVEGLEKARFLLPVVSPNYIQRTWCQEELQRFAGDDADTTSLDNRIIPVYKLPVDPSQQPPLLRGRRGYPFYDAATGKDYFRRGKPVDEHGYDEQIDKITDYINQALPPVSVVGPENRFYTTGATGLSDPPASPDDPQSTRGADVHRADDALTRYFRSILTDNSTVEIRGMGAQVAETLPLDQVYTRLHVSARDDALSKGANVGRGERGDALRESGREMANRELRDILPRHPHIALIGDPGAGKTTFLRFVAQQLAHASLDRAHDLEKLGLRGPSPFPIFIRADALSRFLVEHPDSELPDDSPKHFERYLDFWQNGHFSGLESGTLRERLLDGGCFVLVDGLDEVPGQDNRVRLSALLQAVVREGAKRSQPASH